MRISTSQFFAEGSAGFNRQREIVSTLQQQISSLKRVNKPSDDPVASARILDTRQAQSRNQQFITNSHMVDSALEFADVSLGAMADLVIEMKTLAINAGSAARSPENLKQIGADMSKKMEQFASLLNTKDGQGRYLFSGTKANTQPYAFKPITSTSTDADVRQAFVYQGNDGQKLVQVGSDRFIAISEPASAFLGQGSQPVIPAGTVTPLNSGNPPTTTAQGNAVNPLLYNMAKLTQHLLQGRLGPEHIVVPNTALNPWPAPPAPPPTRPATVEEERMTLNNAISAFDAGLEKLSTARAGVGARRLESSQGRELGEDLDLVYNKAVHQLEDLDIAKASADLTMARAALEASQLSFSKIQGLSLFNYM